MRRRALLATCAGCMPILAGCTGTEAPSAATEQRHPFADASVSVRIDNRSDTDHDIETNGREALAFWEAHAEQYVGFGVEFEVVDETPDLTIAYVDTPEPCWNVDGFSELVLGCAPLITSRHRLPDDLTAYVVAATRPFGKIRITTKHELGHILGLDHDDEPREIMSNRPEDRIPLYELRIEIWEAVLAAQEWSNDGTQRYNHGIAMFTEERYAAARTTFTAANDAYHVAREHVDDALEKTEGFDGHPRVETVALDALRSHLERLVARTIAAIGFSRSMAAASAAAAEGDGSKTNEQLTAANEYSREFFDLGPVELRDVAVTLGLVRGFDRDEPVVDMEDDRS